MFEYIKDLKLPQSRGYATRGKTDLIVLHHFESDASVLSVAEYHISKGHAGIDYNIIVQLDGTVVWGRGLEFVGGHTMNRSDLSTYGVNARSVGIACQGDFNKVHMSAAQKESLKRVVADVVIYYGLTSIKQIVTHKEIAGADYTDCPGKYYPSAQLKEFIRTYKPPIIEQPVETPVDVPIEVPGEIQVETQVDEPPVEPPKEEPPKVIDYTDPNQEYPVTLPDGWKESGGAQKQAKSKKKG